MPKYIKPDWMTKHVFNALLAGAAKVGLSLRGSRVLAVRGRKSGGWRTTPVNPLTIGERALPRRRRAARRSGCATCARPAAVSCGSAQAEAFVASEVGDAEKPPILRDYLKYWKMETGKFFEDRTAESSDAELLEIAPLHPIFVITTAERAR